MGWATASSSPLAGAVMQTMPVQRRPVAGAAAPTSPAIPPGTQLGTAPTFAPLGATSGLGFANSLLGYQNQANKANNDRYNQGLSVLGGMQSQVNDLYGGAQGDVAGVGQQALDRINQQEQKNLSTTQQSAISRGLGNTTIADTMKDLPTREANDARQGVNEMQAQLRAGLKTQQAGAVMNNGNSIANFVAARNDTGPNAAMFSQLAQASAAGNNGEQPAMRKATIMGGSLGGGSNFGGSSSGGGSSGGNYGGASSGGGGGYSGGGGGGYFGGGGAGGGGGGSFGGGGDSSGYDPSMILPGSNWFMPDGGGVGNVAGASGSSFMNNTGDNSITPLPDGLPPGAISNVVQDPNDPNNPANKANKAKQPYQATTFGGMLWGR